jgi:hypothetical protein
VSFRKRIFAREGEKIQYDGVVDYLRTNYRKLLGRPYKRTHWTRGLCVKDQSIFVGQSTWAGDTAPARVVEICKNSSLIKNCLYLDIPEYPETRIFQLISI